MPSIVVAGAGPGVGTEIARRFGCEGYRTIISARDERRLKQTAADMVAEGIDAQYVSMDLSNEDSAARGFEKIDSLVGTPDVLVFNPRVNYAPPYSVMDVDVSTVEAFLQTSLFGVIRCARQVLPGMLSRGSGTLLFTIGASANSPVPMMAPVGVATAGIVNYADVLDAELAQKGILVGTVTIGVLVKPGSPTSPQLVAELYWDAHARTAPRSQFFPKSTD
jgi:NAD(P)-dependent dehydrogenase (short-subunit alcohol dehydrogenase family)